MRRRTIFLLLSFCFALVMLSFTEQYQQVPPKPAIRTLVIDPGHGGIDPGARGSFSNEADVSLAVSLKFGKALEKEFPDLKIVYTRTKDIMPGNKPTKDEGLRYRAELANESAGDLFIAIHCNSASPIRHFIGYRKVGKKRYRRYSYSPNPANGTETYIWAVNKNDAKINTMNKMEYYGEIDSTGTESSTALELPDPSDPAEFARMLIYAQQYFRKSLSLAEMIEKEFVATGRNSRGVKQRNDKGIWVLQATTMPSILVEIGFISNKEEEQYINSDKGQNEIVEDLVNAFKSYRERLESRAINGTN